MKLTLKLRFTKSHLLNIPIVWYNIASSRLELACRLARIYEFLVNTQLTKCAKYQVSVDIVSRLISWLSDGRTRDLCGLTARRIEMLFGVDVGLDQVTLC